MDIRGTNRSGLPAFLVTHAFNRDMSTRTVAVVTGTRAEYGLLATVMDSIEARDDLALEVVATGTHLSPQHGHTVDEIEADGFEVAHRVNLLLDSDSRTAMAKSLGIGVSSFADGFDLLDPDIVLVLGDRYEAFAAGVAAAHMNIPVAHIHGGDVMQGAVIDDSIRHALTKFAHLHFPASELSADRIEQLGEEPWRITVAGAPGLDAVLAEKYRDPETVAEQHDLTDDVPLGLVVQHPLTTQPKEAGRQMRKTLDALADVDLQGVLVYPNADAGSKRMIEEIESTTLDRFRVFKNLPRDEFLGLMAAADVMAGNSSSGIIEAPSFGLPVVDIGPRQEGRERADNVVSVPHETDEIREAIERCLTDRDTIERAASCENPYDYGGAGDRIARRLAEVDLSYDLLRKRAVF